MPFLSPLHLWLPSWWKDLMMYLVLCSALRTEKYCKPIQFCISIKFSWTTIFKILTPEKKVFGYKLRKFWKVLTFENWQYGWHILKKILITCLEKKKENYVKIPYFLKMCLKLFLYLIKKGFICQLGTSLGWHAG